MTAIENGKIILCDGVAEHRVLLIRGDRIAGLAESADGADRVIDARGRYVMPGLIDVHSDRIEQYIQPRPTSQMDFELALKECERELLNCGITTIYHSMSLMKDEIFGAMPLRTRANVEKFARLVSDVHNRGHLIHHRLHLRLEIDNPDAFEIAGEMIRGNLVHEISFMDHTPGQGQYRNLEIYRRSVTPLRSGKAVTMEELMVYHQTKQVISAEKLRELAGLAHQNDIPVASHDDDTEEKLAVNQFIGVDISEFPILLETARSARRRGFVTVIGAPNILLGGSHSGNMSAAEAVRAGCADILCSDYYPPAVLHGIFYMHTRRGVPLWEMVRKATLAPAQAMRIDGDYGSLEPGKKADLLIVDLLDGYPVVTHALVDGIPALHVEYRR